MARIEKPGFCTLCRSRCGTIYTVEDDRLVSVRPDPSHPTGKAMCPKGRAAPEIAHSARRLTTPLRRTAPKGAADPGFVPISWDEAFAEIAGKLGRYREESGPESVAFAITSGSSSSTSDSIDWLQRFVRGFGSPNTVFSTEICNWHKDSAHAFTFGCGLPTAEYRQSDLILLWGHNPANVWLAQAEAIGAARARGAKLAVIDPRQAGSAREADLWLRIRPGTDGALALGIARWLIANEAYDAEFVRHWTNAAFLVRDDDGLFLRAADIGMEGEGFVVWDHALARPVTADGALGEAALEGRFVVDGPDGPVGCRTAFDHYRAAAEPYDPATVEAITTIPAAQVEALARAIAAAGSVSYHGWTGIGQHTNAAQTERAIATLYALTGHFDAPGGNVRMPAVPAPSLHAMAMIPPETRKKALGLDKRPIGPPADGWITSSDFYDAAIAGKPYRIRALFGFGSNLLVSHPAPERGREALQALEFQVHCDLFLNPTAEMADIVLPVSSPWEHEALRLGFELSLEAQERVQLRPQMVPRRGEARSDMWIVFQLAKHLGMGELFFDGDVEKGFAHLLAPLGLDLETLRAKPEGVRVPLTHAYRKYRQTGFATQTGKAELYSELLHRHGYPAVPDFVPPAEGADGALPADTVLGEQRLLLPQPASRHHDAAPPPRGADRRDSSGSRTAQGHLGRRLAPAEHAEGPDTPARRPQRGIGRGCRRQRLRLVAAGSRSRPARLSSRRGQSDRLELQRDHLGDRARSAQRLAGPALLRLRCRVAGGRRLAGLALLHRRGTARGRHRCGLALTLKPADGGVLPAFRPGQYVGLRLAGQIRSYSLTGAAVPAPDAYRIAVREIAGGVVSGAARRELLPGTQVELQAPKGGFVPAAEQYLPGRSGRGRHRHHAVPVLSGDAGGAAGRAGHHAPLRLPGCDAAALPRAAGDPAPAPAQPDGRHPSVPAETRGPA